MLFSAARKMVRLQILGLCISLALGTHPAVVYANDGIQFNKDVLDIEDRENIDLSQFSSSGYIMQGSYKLAINVNQHTLSEREISFYAPDDDPKGSRACITQVLVEQLGLKKGLLSKLTWWHQDQCLDESSLKGMEVRGDLATSTLYLSIPQVYLEYTSDDWDPPSRWDDGIPGLLLDYGVNAQARQQKKQGTRDYSVSGNGVAGVNLGAWRLRADWQGTLNRESGGLQPNNNRLEWGRYYAYRAVPALSSTLTLGEDYLQSRIFDSFRFSGAALSSDDSMLPPNLRGYAPEVAGIARTNAKVTVSQQGRVLYETQVAAGPFRIQDLHDSVAGILDVRVEEQDGSEQEFKITTANIPYLARPGSVRYKLSVGKPSDWQHNTEGSLFGSGEFSWGVSNGWSLYGGALLGSEYNAVSLGMGRDLMVLGALSFDVSQSRVKLPAEKGTFAGHSYRVNYSKDFQELDSKVTVAGYRFSDENFMSMDEYLKLRNQGMRAGSSKEMYSITFNKQFRDWGLSSYLNYSHQTYWNSVASENYNLSISRNFDVGKLRNMNVSVSAYRSRSKHNNDDGMYLSLSVPWGNRVRLNYNSTLNRKNITQNVGYFDSIDEHNNYQLSAGKSRSGNNLSGFYSNDGDASKMSVNASYQERGHSAVGISAIGGMTLTPEGGAVHRVGTMGGTRLLVDTGGVSGIPVGGYGKTSKSNMFGKVVVSDVNSYIRSNVNIDLNKLSDNVEATKSVVQATLTEGAIGYRKLNVIAGQKAMAVIKLANGSEPPFGATVINARGQETGVITEGGSVYLSGINAGDSMSVHWSGTAQCEVRLPSQLPEEMLTSNLLLPCNLIPEKG